MRVHILALLYVIGLHIALVTQSAAASDQVLTSTNLGAVRIGMTVPEAEKALAYKLKPLDKNDGISNDSCWLTERADGKTPWLTYMVEYGKIVRIDVWEEASSVPPVSTREGIRIGASQELVIEKYGTNVVVTLHPHMEADGAYMELSGPDKQHGLLFEAVHGKIVNLRAGKLPNIQLIERAFKALAVQKQRRSHEDGRQNPYI